MEPRGTSTLVDAQHIERIHDPRCPDAILADEPNRMVSVWWRHHTRLGGGWYRESMQELGKAPVPGIWKFNDRGAEPSAASLARLKEIADEMEGTGVVIVDGRNTANQEWLPSPEDRRRHRNEIYVYG